MFNFGFIYFVRNGIDNTEKIVSFPFLIQYFNSDINFDYLDTRLSSDEIKLGLSGHFDSKEKLDSFLSEFSDCKVYQFGIYNFDVGFLKTDLFDIGTIGEIFNYNKECEANEAEK